MNDRIDFDQPSYAEQSQITWQHVTPETMQNIIQKSMEMVRFQEVDALLKEEWMAVEMSGMNLNIIRTKKSWEESEALPLINQTTELVGKILKTTNLSAKDLPYSTIVILPNSSPKATVALFINDECYIVVRESLRGLPHEISHRACGIFVDHSSFLLSEGFAEWLVNRSLTIEEQKKYSDEDPYLYQAQRAYKMSFVNTKTELNMDDSISPTFARYYGPVLIDVLTDMLGYQEEPFKMLQASSSCSKYDKVSDWIKSLGLDVELVDAQWKQKMTPQISATIN